MSGASQGAAAGVSGSGGEAGVPPLRCDEGLPLLIEPDEVTHRLTSLFWEARPTPELAAEGRTFGLTTSGAVGCFARGRILPDARADAGIRSFFEGWLDLGSHVAPIQDPAHVPEFSPQLFAEAKQASLETALRSVRDGYGLRGLLTSQVVTVNAAVAPLYGEPAPRNGQFESRFREERAGILSEVYFLMRRATRAHGSPAQRGWGITEMLGCMDQNELPDGIGPSFVPTEFEGTTRDWYETNMMVGNCAGCHLYLTAQGFLLENFDVLGRFRTTEAGLPIDSSAWLQIVESEPVAVDGPFDAMHLLAESTLVRRCFAAHFREFALASLEGERQYATDPPGAAPEVEQIAARAARDSRFDLLEMMIASVETASFLAP